MAEENDIIKNCARCNRRVKQVLYDKKSNGKYYAKCPVCRMEDQKKKNVQKKELFGRILDEVKDIKNDLNIQAEKQEEVKEPIKEEVIEQIPIPPLPIQEPVQPVAPSVPHEIIEKVMKNIKQSEPEPEKPKEQPIDEYYCKVTKQGEPHKYASTIGAVLIGCGVLGKMFSSPAPVASINSMVME